MACYICGSEQELQKHHVVPQALGGKSTDGKVDLCNTCHRVVDRNGPYKLEHLEDIIKGGERMLMLILMRVNAYVENMKIHYTIEKNLQDIIDERAVVKIESNIAAIADKFIENPNDELLIYQLKNAVKALRKYKSIKLTVLEEKFREHREEAICEDNAARNGNT